MLRRKRASSPTRRRPQTAATAIVAPAAAPVSEKKWWERTWAVGLAWSVGLLGILVGIVSQLFPLLQPLWQTSPLPDVNASATARRAASIHVGFSESAIEAELGAAIKEEPLSGDLGWMQKTYARDDVAVTAVIDSDGDIRLYSLLLCHDESNLRIETPSGTTVVLQGPALSHVETDEGDESDLNDRALHYLDGFTGSSLGHLFEESLDQPRSGNGWRQYFIGVNRVCGETGFMSGGGGGISYFGPTETAGTEIRNFRDREPANFYTEVADNVAVTDDTSFVFRTPDGDVAVPYGSPYIHDLPSDWLSNAR
jgi:hypothetical protein